MDIQARLYWRIIKKCLSLHKEFEDYELSTNYIFVVVNRNTLIPLVWKFEDADKDGTLKYTNSKGFVYHFRDPFDIGEDLHHYLHTSSRVPIGINVFKTNNIVEWLKK